MSLLLLLVVILFEVKIKDIPIIKKKVDLADPCMIYLQTTAMVLENLAMLGSILVEYYPDLIYAMNVNSQKKIEDWVLKNTLTSEAGFPSW